MLHYLASLKQYCHERHDFLLVMKQETVQLLNNLMSVLSSLCHVKNHSNCNFVSAITASNLVSFSSLSKCNISAKKIKFYGEGLYQIGCRTLHTKLSCSVAILQMFFVEPRATFCCTPSTYPPPVGRGNPLPHLWRLTLDAFGVSAYLPLRKISAPFPSSAPASN